MWQAKKYIEKLNKDRFAGFSDWRLPTIPEPLSLVEKQKKENMYINQLVDAKQRSCGSMDNARPYNNMDNEVGGWIVSFFRGKAMKANWFESGAVSAWHDWYRHYDKNNVRAVRHLSRQAVQ